MPSNTHRSDVMINQFKKITRSTKARGGMKQAVKDGRERLLKGDIGFKVGDKVCTPPCFLLPLLSLVLTFLLTSVLASTLISAPTFALTSITGD
jgi:hypothetical protein